MNSELPPNERPPDATASEGMPMSGPMLGGLVLIAVGVIFLLVNTGVFSVGVLPNNWWALFFLLPIFGILGNLFRSYQRQDGSFRHAAASQLVGLAILTLIMFVFLFGWSWGNIWPAFLIIAGIGALARSWAGQG